MARHTGRAQRATPPAPVDLVQYRHHPRRLRRLVNRKQIIGKLARLAQIRYREGVANYLEVLDAERNLFTAEQSLLALRRQELSNLAALYAALGGGPAPGS